MSEIGPIGCIYVLVATIPMIILIKSYGKEEGNYMAYRAQKKAVRWTERVEKFTEDDFNVQNNNA